MEALEGPQKNKHIYSLQMNVKVKHNLDISNINPIIEASGSVCNLEDVFFFSGARSIPPAGWPKKTTLQFSHQSQFPTSSTCSLILRLPAMHTSYDSFKEAMVLGIKGNARFGGP